MVTDLHNVMDYCGSGGSVVSLSQSSAGETSADLCYQVLALQMRPYA